MSWKWRVGAEQGESWEKRDTGMQIIAGLESPNHVTHNLDLEPPPSEWARGPLLKGTAPLLTSMSPSFAAAFPHKTRPRAGKMARYRKLLPHNCKDLSWTPSILINMKNGTTDLSLTTGEVEAAESLELTGQPSQPTQAASVRGPI